MVLFAGSFAEARVLTCTSSCVCGEGAGEQDEVCTEAAGGLHGSAPSLVFGSAVSVVGIVGPGGGCVNAGGG